MQAMHLQGGTSNHELRGTDPAAYRPHDNAAPVKAFVSCKISMRVFRLGSLILLYKLKQPIHSIAD